MLAHKSFFLIFLYAVWNILKTYTWTSDKGDGFINSNLQIWTEITLNIWSVEICISIYKSLRMLFPNHATKLMDSSHFRLSLKTRDSVTGRYCYFSRRKRNEWGRFKVTAHIYFISGHLSQAHVCPLPLKYLRAISATRTNIRRSLHFSFP